MIFGRIAKDPRFERLPCIHKGTYADDCLVNRVTQVMLPSYLVSWFVVYGSIPFVCLRDVLVLVYIQHKCFIVATCDRDLKRRIRKVMIVLYVNAFFLFVLDIFGC